MTPQEAKTLLPGDQVMCIEEHLKDLITDSHYSAGRIYVVKKVSLSGADILTEYDNQNRPDNGWGCENFDFYSNGKTIEDCM